MLGCINDAQVLTGELAEQFVNMLYIHTMCIKASVSVLTACYRVVKDIFLVETGVIMLRRCFAFAAWIFRVNLYWFFTFDSPCTLGM